MLFKFIEVFMKNICLEDLKNTEKLLCLNCIPFILWIVDSDGKIIFANQKFIDYFGIDEDLIKKKNDLETYLPKELLEFNPFKNPIKSISITELNFTNQGDKSVWLEIHHNFLKDSDNRNIGSFLIAHDISEKKELENYQIRIKNQLKALIKILTNPVDNISTEDLISMSIQTIFDFFSEYRISYLQVENNSLILQYSVEPNNFSSISNSISEIEELKSYLSYLQIQGYQYYNDVRENNTKQISPIFIDYSVRSLVDIPISFGHNVIAILRIDTEKIHYWMEDEILSFAEIGKNLSIIIQRNIYNQQMQEYENNLIENYNKLEQNNNELKELKELYENRSEELFLNRELLEEQAFSINLLNQQLIDKEEMIIESNKQLENALIQRDKFFSIIAHDLRGPLSSFLGMTKMINEQSDQFTKEELVEISGLIHKNAETLYSLIENLLNWSRLQRNEVLVEPQFINVKVSTDVAISIYKESMKKKGIDLIDKVQSNHFIYADLHMFDSVLRNLISNAVKFTPKNGRIYIESYEVDNNYIGISVTDNGIGMSEELVSKLFKIDEKTSRNGTEGEPSTGLGLVLCKELIERNEGALNVTSSEGIGSKFEIILPKKQMYEDIID